MKENLLRHSEPDEETAAIWWKDGGLQVKIDGKWWVRMDNTNYTEAREKDVEMYESIVEGGDK